MTVASSVSSQNAKTDSSAWRCSTGGRQAGARKSSSSGKQDSAWKCCASSTPAESSALLATRSNDCGGFAHGGGKSSIVKLRRRSSRHVADRELKGRIVQAQSVAAVADDVLDSERQWHGVANGGSEPELGRAHNNDEVSTPLLDRSRG